MIRSTDEMTETVQEIACALAGLANGNNGHGVPDVTEVGVTPSLADAVEHIASSLNDDEESSLASAIVEASKDENNAVAVSLRRVARALEYLGNGDATTQMGAIEGLAMQVRDGFSSLSDAIKYGMDDTSGSMLAIAEGLQAVAKAIREKGAGQ